jgi:hypothetical protein
MNFSDQEKENATEGAVQLTAAALKSVVDRRDDTSKNELKGKIDDLATAVELKTKDFKQSLTQELATKEDLKGFPTKEDLKEALKGFATKEDLKEALKGFATKEDLKGFPTKEDLKEALKGFATKEDLKGFPTKEDLKGFATKEDLKGFATKEDLKGFATKEDSKGFATKEDLNVLGKKIGASLENQKTRAYNGKKVMLTTVHSNAELDWPVLEHGSRTGMVPTSLPSKVTKYEYQKHIPLDKMNAIKAAYGEQIKDSPDTETHIYIQVFLTGP